MNRKKLYMIGNSHIDPVWFWDWEEGLQEVKMTFLSALDRLKEFGEVKFTCTSAAFLEWIEEILPEQFEEIRQRVAEGRWELTGGWFIEPDCNLPSGEAFVRQGLYAQRYFKDRFGVIAETGSNVDSFGHSPTLPQILKKSGMDNYIFMRPRLNTPVFVWESADGSRVNAVSLPSEYTTWFYEKTKEQIELARAALEPAHTDGLPCCYGVGNHGGGPTIENIESIYKLRQEYPDTELCFAGFGDYFREADYGGAPVLAGALEYVNTGCYELDSDYKRMNRLCEKQLVTADKRLSLCRTVTGTWPEDTAQMERLWKGLLFNQFHDTLGGTAIKEARDQAYRQLCAVEAGCGRIIAAAEQAVMNSLDTRGAGFPLFLFHSGNEPFDGYVTAELNWFCKHPLKIADPDGREVAYQRVHTRAKVRNYNIGGRRRVVFRAQIPSQGFAVYRVMPEESSLTYNNGWEIDRPDPYVLENTHLRAEFDRTTGNLASIRNKHTGYEALRAPVTYDIWYDERDAWGHLQPGEDGVTNRPYGPSGEHMTLKSIEKSESGAFRECVHVIYEYHNSTLEQFYYLYDGEEEIVVETRIFWMEGWKTLRMRIPIADAAGGELRSRSECAYGILERRHEAGEAHSPGNTCFMQRFADVSLNCGAGIAAANDGRYGFFVNDGCFHITLARSAVYAQGNGVNWYNPSEGYEYTDIGRMDVTIVIKPHATALKPEQLYRLAERAQGTVGYMLDGCHGGKKAEKRYSLASTADPAVRIETIKKAEDDADYVVRLLETGGQDKKTCFLLGGKQFEIELGRYEIATVKINLDTNEIRKVNLLELK